MEDERRGKNGPQKTIWSSWPRDPRSDTLLTVIIKTVFSDKELTNENARWAQSVVETIFDTNHLSPKIDADIIESWTEALTDTATDTEMELVNILVYVLVF